MSEPQQAVRQVYMVLSPRSLGYARAALGSLFARSLEPLHLRLITDSADDRRTLEDAIAPLPDSARHTVSVLDADSLRDAEAERFRGLDRLRAFRHGHPCWRKITDPLLLAAPGEELVLLDPDLYFPNRFRFEATPAKGLALMWQRPNCLLPPDVVRAAFDGGVRLARHVDIGVAHWRAAVNLDWLEWLLGRLAGGAAPETLPRMMHIEAIVWAAIAWREGGGYLHPERWVCWHRSQGKRLGRKLGMGGDSILRGEPWTRMKCFHAGGEAKWWVPDYVERHPEPERTVDTPTTLRPFVELTRRIYEREQRGKRMLHRLGYYRVFAAKHP